MELLTGVLAVFLAIIFFLVVFTIFLYNSLVRARNFAQNA